MKNIIGDDMMDEHTLVNRILEIFPRVTFQVTRKNNNLRIHFKADPHNYVPSKEYLCNALDLPEDRVKVAFKTYDDGIKNGPGKLFTILGGIYL